MPYKFVIQINVRYIWQATTKASRRTRLFFSVRTFATVIFIAHSRLCKSMRTFQLKKWHFIVKNWICINIYILVLESLLINISFNFQSFSIPAAIKYDTLCTLYKQVAQEFIIEIMPLREFWMMLIHFWALKFSINWPNINEIDQNAENWHTQISIILSSFTRHICLQSVHINWFRASGYWLSYVYSNLISSLEFSIVCLIIQPQFGTKHTHIHNKRDQGRKHIDREAHTLIINSFTKSYLKCVCV